VANESRILAYLSAFRFNDMVLTETRESCQKSVSIAAAVP